MRESIAKSIKSTVKDLHQIGVVDEITMKNIENLCLPDIGDYSPQKITAIRKRFQQFPVNMQQLVITTIV